MRLIRLTPQTIPALVLYPTEVREARVVSPHYCDSFALYMKTRHTSGNQLGFQMQFCSLPLISPFQDDAQCRQNNTLHMAQGIRIPINKEPSP